MFKGLDLRVDKGDKIAFLGPLDRVKTTLFQVLMGELQPDKGTFKWGASTTRAYYPKENGKYFETDLSLVDWLRQFSKETDENFIRGFLGRMMMGSRFGVAVVPASGGPSAWIAAPTQIQLVPDGFVVRRVSRWSAMRAAADAPSLELGPTMATTLSRETKCWAMPADWMALAPLSWMTSSSGSDPPARATPPRALTCSANNSAAWRLEAPTAWTSPVSSRLSPSLTVSGGGATSPQPASKTAPRRAKREDKSGATSRNPAAQRGGVSSRTAGSSDLWSVKIIGGAVEMTL
jgi:energy-coupling factor transporter ATP-binding protein EcfA2